MDAIYLVCLLDVGVVISLVGVIRGAVLAGVAHRYIDIAALVIFPILMDGAAPRMRSLDPSGWIGRCRNAKNAAYHYF